MSMSEIIERLSGEGIPAERKSIYTDIEVLKDSGLDIELKKGRGGGYYVASRDFELAEVKLLADAVSASKFVTEKRSRGLLSKLEALVSEPQAGELKRQVVVTDRAKTENEAVVYAIDTIHGCIDRNARMSFCYMEWDDRKHRILRRGGKRYLVSPVFLLWDNENYYLVAYDEDGGQIRHYRVDKIVRAREEPNKISKEVIAYRKKRADYTRHTFGMYAGKDETVSVRIDASLINVFVDRFGTAIPLRADDGRYVARISVAVSPQFFGWMAGFRDRVEIVAPERVRDEYITYISDIAGVYGGGKA